MEQYLTKEVVAIILASGFLLLFIATFWDEIACRIKEIKKTLNTKKAKKLKKNPVYIGEIYYQNVHRTRKRFYAFTRSDVEAYNSNKDIDQADSIKVKGIWYNATEFFLYSEVYDDLRKQIKGIHKE